MAATTTLMTFMVRTPPSTRSVSLWGSWDNFTTPYLMKRDSRIGPEHWSGCHTFTNIICDGPVDRERQPRQGGLKMGGTYWYYYMLDDDLEFHNAVEPSTTKCPLLPGQLVNVLNVPFVLSGNRSRNTSISSTSSDCRTMNPNDKYINPRPVPKPQLPRLRTSPTLQQQDLWPTFTPTSTSSPRAGRSATSAGTGSASTLRFRSKSPGSAFSGSIRSAFKSFRTPRSRSPRAKSPPNIIISPANDAFGSTRIIPSADASRDASPHLFLEHDLLLRRTANLDPTTESIEVSSFQEHRRQHSRSRDPISLRTSLVFDTNSPVIFPDFESQRAHVLDTLKEATPTHRIPANPVIVDVVPQSPTEDPVNLEKRLPTLPNTPSSAYPPSTVFSESIDMKVLESHFSSTTIDTSESEDEAHTPDSLHFSGWSGRHAHDSFYTNRVTVDEPMGALSAPCVTTPKRACGYGDVGDTEFEDTPQQSSGPRKILNLSTAFSTSTMSSTSTISLPTSPIEEEDFLTGVDSPLDRKGSDTSSRLQYQHYRLPTADLGSEITLKSPTTKREGLMELPPGFEYKGKVSPAPGDAMIAHSTSMAKLMEELSYLGNMIHQN